MGSPFMEKNFKGLLFRHPGILPLARPQCQLSLGILPVDIDH